MNPLSLLRDGSPVIVGETITHNGHLVVTKEKKSILQFRKLCSNILTTNYHVRKVDKSKQLLKVIQNFCLDVNLPELIFQIYMVPKKSLK
jgi:hypothetical protein